MSVLYQALKRQEQAAGAGPAAPGYYPARARRRRFPISLVIILISLGAIGYFAYDYYGGFAVLSTTPEGIIAGPSTAAAEPNAIVDLPVVDVQNVADIAALMPAGAKAPLPVDANAKKITVGRENGTAAVVERARQLQANGARDAALRLYEETGDDYVSRLNRWGIVGENDPQRALPFLKALATERPDYAPAHAQLGLVYARLSNPEDARQSLITATSLSPYSAQIWYNAAVVADQTGDTKFAETAYQNALMNNDDGAPLDRAAIQRRLNYLRGR